MNNKLDTIHVLLIEGNDLAFEMLTSTKFKIKLSTAKDSVQAMEILCRDGSYSHRWHRTLILLDLDCPHKDSRQVLSILKNDEQLRHIPVVVLASSASETDIASCYHLGANCYLVKPSDLHAYQALMRTLEAFWLGAVRLPRHEVIQ